MTREKGREGERDGKVGGAGEGRGSICDSGIRVSLRGYPLRFVILRNPMSSFPIETCTRPYRDPLCGALVENPCRFIIQALQSPIVETYGSSLYIPYMEPS